MSRLLAAASSQSLDNNTGPVSAYPITASLWLRLTTFAADQCFLWLGNSAATNAWLALAGDTDGYFLAQSRNTTSTIFAQSTSSPASFVGAWVHILARWTSDTSRDIAVNGVVEANNATSQTIPTINRISIGRYGDSTPAGHADGEFAHPAVWNVALSNDEIAMLGAARVSPLMVRPQSLAFYAPYLGRDGTEIDIIGKRNLTVTGATASGAEPPQMWIPGRRRILRAVAGVTLAQVNTRWRADDGSQSGASWLAAENTAINAARDTNTRLRLSVRRSA